MNSHTKNSSAAAVLLLGLLAALPGCAGSIRQSTSLHPSTRAVPLASLGANVQAPVPLRTVAPEYPYELKRSGVTGLVNVVCLVDEQGRVQEAAVEQSTHDAFAAPAVDALQRWTFQPARRDGQPVAMRVNIPVNFTLTDE